MAKDRRARVAQLRAAYQLARRDDPRLPLWLAVPAVVILGAFIGIGFGIGHPIYFSVIGLLLALVVAMIIFGRRASASAFRSIEGQAGAAAAVLNSLRGDWRVTPAVGFNRNQDLVHRVLGRPGVVLIGEGSSQRVGQLIGAEKRRVGRVVGDTPMYDLVVGDGAGQVPLRQLQRHLTRLPRNLKARQINIIENRLKALGGGGPSMPIPKGPIPKNARLPRSRPR